MVSHAPDCRHDVVLLGGFGLAIFVSSRLFWRIFDYVREVDEAQASGCSPGC